LVIRGEIWWAELADPAGSEPGFSRPVLLVSADRFNTTKISTVIVVYIYSNLSHGRHPGNVLLTSKDTGLDRDSIANVTQIGTLDKLQVRTRIGAVPPSQMLLVDDGLRKSMQL
jgi:mRNA interferase MazF